MKLLLPTERKNARCWFCRTDKSVKYAARMINTNPLSEHRYMDILVCNKCALNHQHDFIKYEED